MHAKYNSWVPIALMFPGQGSQAPGMGREFFESSAPFQDAIGQVSDAAGLDIQKLLFESDEETLRQTQNAQLALYAVSVGSFAALKAAAPGLEPVGAAGHSVGEYAALAAAGAFSIGDGAKLVRRRGDLMARAGKLRPGAMAAILGIEDSVIESECKNVSPGAVVVANYNSPGQAVISGDEGAVDAACEALKAAGAKRCLRLNVSGAFHSPLMAEAAESMSAALAEVDFAPPRFPVVSNVTAQAEASNWKDLLTRQIDSPVRWTQSVRTLHSMGADTFLECGSGEVLCGLLKRIEPGATGIPIGNPANLDAFAAGAVSS